MRILTFTHHLEVGGSQVNAVDVASGLVARGHQVDVFATPGPARQLLLDRNLPYIEAPAPSANPSPAVVRALAAQLARERYDVLHAWDWPQCIDAVLATRRAKTIPIVGSIMSMVVTRVVPPSLPLTYGTPELVDAARERGYQRVSLLEPPINTALDDVNAVDGPAFRREIDVADSEILVTVVSRLVGWLKLEGIKAAMESVGELAAQFPVRLVVVGGGTAEGELRELAARTNAVVGREVVTMTGTLVDPRPAYAAADIVIGMGGSILRGMTYGRPAIVLGESGFAQTFDESSSGDFLYRGMYGLGDGGDLTDRLRRQLAQLLASPARRRELGQWSRDVMITRYGLEPVVASFEQFIETDVVGAPRRIPVREVAESLARRTRAGTLDQLDALKKRRKPSERSSP